MHLEGDDGEELQQQLEPLQVGAVASWRSEPARKGTNQ
jgi:hypothetical protein